MICEPHYVAGGRVCLERYTTFGRRRSALVGRLLVMADNYARESGMEYDIDQIYTRAQS